MPIQEIRADLRKFMLCRFFFPDSRPSFFRVLGVAVVALRWPSVPRTGGGWSSWCRRCRASPFPERVLVILRRVLGMFVRLIWALFDGVLSVSPAPCPARRIAEGPGAHMRRPAPPLPPPLVVVLLLLSLPLPPRGASGSK